LLILCYFFFENIFTILVVWGLASVSTLFAVFMKYASFPEQLGIKETLLVSICFVFPPLVIAAIPFLYFQSLKNLSKVL
jgi:hypothetical protein